MIATFAFNELRKQGARKRFLTKCLPFFTIFSFQQKVVAQRCAERSNSEIFRESPRRKTIIEFISRIANVQLTSFQERTPW